MTLNQAKSVNANANTTEEVYSFAWDVTVANDSMYAVAA
jgi:hypothetical protein